MYLLSASIRALRLQFEDLDRLKANERSFRLHYLMVTFFLLTAVIEYTMIFASFIHAVTNGSALQNEPSTYATWFLTYRLTNSVGHFCGFSILMYMFWSYTLSPEICDQP